MMVSLKVETDNAVELCMGGEPGRLLNKKPTHRREALSGFCF